MDEQTKATLESILETPQTGQAYNRQQLFAQVQGVFVMNSLQDEIAGLRSDMRDAGKQSAELAQSNNRLQLAALALSSVGVAVAVFEFAGDSLIRILQEAFQEIPGSIFEIVPILSALITGVLSFVTQKKFVNVQVREQITVTDSLDMLVKDEDGNVKDERHS